MDRIECPRKDNLPDGIPSRGLPKASTFSNAQASKIVDLRVRICYRRYKCISSPVGENTEDQRSKARLSDKIRSVSRLQCQISHRREINDEPAKVVRIKNGNFSSLSNSVQNGRIRFVNAFNKVFFKSGSEKNCRFSSLGPCV